MTTSDLWRRIIKGLAIVLSAGIGVWDQTHQWGATLVAALMSLLAFLDKTTSPPPALPSTAAAMAQVVRVADAIKTQETATVPAASVDEIKAQLDELLATLMKAEPNPVSTDSRRQDDDL